MDAAFAAFKKTALFLALSLALLASMPGLAQATPPHFTSPTAGAAITLIGGGSSSQVNVTGSTDADGDYITFTVVVGYTSGDLPWLAVGSSCNPGSNNYVTPQTLTLALGCNAGSLSSGSHTANVTLVPQSPSGTANLTFTVTYNPTGGSVTPLTANPTSLTLTALPGATASSPVTVGTVSTSAISFTAASSDTSWLTVTPTSGEVESSTPATLNITANAAGKTAVSSPYLANITVTYGSSQRLIIPVTLNVTATAVVFSPNTLAWTYANNTLSPLGSQTVTLSTSNNDAYTAAVSYPAGETPTNWLLINNATTQGNLANGSTFAVSVVNLSGVAPGTYTGTITVTDNAVAANFGTLTVTVTIPSASAALTVTPNPIGLSSANGYDSVVTVTSASGGTLVVSTSSTNNWLSATASANSISAGGSAYVTVTANPSLSGAGVYTGTLTVTVGAASQQVTVNLTAGTSTVVNSSGFVAPTALSFAATAAGASVSQQIVFAGSGTFTISTEPQYSASSGSVAWLTSSTIQGNLSDQGTPVNITVHPYAALQPGTYTATVPITIVANGVQQPALSLAVSFVVASGEVLASTPSTLVFSNGGTLNSSIQVTSSGGSTALPMSVTTDQPWLTATIQGAATATPAAIEVTATTSGMSDGLYPANVVVTSSNAPTLHVPVVVVVTGVTNPSGLTLSSPSLTFVSQIGSGTPPSQTLTVSSDVAGTPFTATVTETTSPSITWLAITPNGSLTTNQAISVAAITTGLAVGSYNGAIALASNGATLNVPVTLTISSAGGGNPPPTGGNVTVSSTTLNFTAVSGGAAPAAQSLTVSSAAGSASVPFTVATVSTGNWLFVNTASATTQAILSVSVNQANLTPGNHSGSITITPTGGTAVVVQVTLDVITEPSFSVSPPSLAFGYQTGSGSIVSPGQLTVTASGGTASFTASAASNGNWLSVTPASGFTSSSTTLAVQVNAASLVASATPYTGTVTIAGANGTVGSQTINVSLTVTKPLPVISSVLNAASSLSGPISPGEIVSIYGSSIGPVNPATLTLTQSGAVSTSIGGVTVSFSGYLAPLTYVSSTQINAVVPYGLASNKGPFVEVMFAGQTSNEPSLQLATSAPGVFTVNGGGTGPAAALNFDGSANSQANPAPRGTAIVLYLTGEGLTNPAQATGTITPVNTSGVGPLTPVPQLAVSVLIGGQPAAVPWYGEAPDLVAGVMQVNVTVPTTIQTGAASVTVQVGKVVSQSGVTIWVK